MKALSQWSFRKMESMGTLASRAETGVWVQAPGALLRGPGILSLEQFWECICRILQSSVFLPGNGSQCRPQCALKHFKLRERRSRAFRQLFNNANGVRTRHPRNDRCSVAEVGPLLTDEKRTSLSRAQSSRASVVDVAAVSRQPGNWERVQTASTGTWFTAIESDIIATLWAFAACKGIQLYLVHFLRYISLYVTLAEYNAE